MVRLDEPTKLIIIIIITKLLLRQYLRKESGSVGHQIQGLGKLIVRVQCKVHQQIDNVKPSGASNTEVRKSHSQGTMLCNYLEITPKRTI